MDIVTGVWVNAGTGNVVIEYEDGNAGLVLVEPDSSSPVLLDTFTPFSGYRRVFPV